MDVLYEYIDDIYVHIISYLGSIRINILRPLYIHVYVHIFHVFIYLECIHISYK